MTKSSGSSRVPDCFQALGAVVVSRQQIADSVAQLADKLARQYRGKELTILAVMTGAMIFVADLIRRLPLRVRLNVISVGSYGDSTASNGKPYIGPLCDDLAGQDVLIVDDILDSGLTLKALIEKVQSMNPGSVRTCVLLRKVRVQPAAVEVDYMGLDIEDKFVVGYGLDYDNCYRNLPDVRKLHPDGAIG